MHYSGRLTFYATETDSVKDLNVKIKTCRCTVPDHISFPVFCTLEQLVDIKRARQLARTASELCAAG